MIRLSFDRATDLGGLFDLTDEDIAPPLPISRGQLNSLFSIRPPLPGGTKAEWTDTSTLTITLSIAPSDEEANALVVGQTSAVLVGAVRTAGQAKAQGELAPVADPANLTLSGSLGTLDAPRCQAQSLPHLASPPLHHTATPSLHHSITSSLRHSRSPWDPVRT